MRILRNAAIAALFVAPLSLGSASAQMMHDDAMGGDAMMHHDMHVTCSVSDMGEKGMTLMFHNMGSDPIPAGSKAHWKVRGMAQGDVSFMQAVPAGGMKEQMYMGSEGGMMMHGHMHAPCSVSMM